MESILSPLQEELIILSREIIAFANENKYKPNMEAIANFRKQYGEDARLVYVSNLLEEGGPSVNGPEYAIYLDNSTWVKELAEKYKERFAARVEDARLKLVELKVVPPDESFYTKFFMSEIKIRGIASYLLSSAFQLDGISVNPTLTSATELIAPVMPYTFSSRVRAIDM
jgi:hypothetical protein